MCIPDGELAQHLRALAEKDEGLIPSTYMEAHHLLSTKLANGARYTCWQNSHTHKIIKINLRKFKKQKRTESHVNHVQSSCLPLGLHLPHQPIWNNSSSQG